MNTSEAFDLVIKNDKLLISQIRSGAFGATKEEIEDIKSLVTIEVVERLVKDFDPSRGMKASTYMGMVARSRALDAMRGRKFHTSLDGNREGTDRVSDHAEIVTMDRSSELASNDRGVAAFEARESLSEALNKLGDKWGGVAFALDYFYHDLDIDDLCVKYEISKMTCYSRANKIRAFLKEELA